jgi:serine/threonine protein kinase
VYELVTGEVLFDPKSLEERINYESYLLRFKRQQTDGSAGTGHSGGSGGSLEKENGIDIVGNGNDENDVELIEKTTKLKIDDETLLGILKEKDAEEELPISNPPYDRDDDHLSLFVATLSPNPFISNNKYHSFVKWKEDKEKLSSSSSSSSSSSNSSQLSPFCKTNDERILSFTQACSILFSSRFLHTAVWSHDLFTLGSASRKQNISYTPLLLNQFPPSPHNIPQHCCLRRGLCKRPFSIFTRLTQVHHADPQQAKELNDFLMLCLEIDPAKRSNAATLLHHPWLTMVDKFESFKEDNDEVENSALVPKAENKPESVNSTISPSGILRKTPSPSNSLSSSSAPLSLSSRSPSTSVIPPSPPPAALSNSIPPITSPILCMNLASITNLPWVEIPIKGAALLQWKGKEEEERDMMKCGRRKVERVGWKERERRSGRIEKVRRDERDGTDDWVSDSPRNKGKQQRTEDFGQHGDKRISQDIDDATADKDGFGGIIE